MMEVKFDDKGRPILLAVRAPGQVAAQPGSSGAVLRRGAASGNPNADPANGRFTSGGGGKRKTNAQLQQDITKPGIRSGVPQGVTVEQWQKRLDMVKDAARSSTEMDAVSARKFLDGKVADLSQVNLQAFLFDVRTQRLDDLSDILDQQLKSKARGILSSNQAVKVSAPTSFVKRVFQGLDDNEVVGLLKRLEGRGWEPGDISSQIVNKIADKGRRAKLQQLYGEQAPESGKKDPSTK